MLNKMLYLKYILIVTIFLIINSTYAFALPPDMPPFVSPPNDTYFKSTTDIELKWQIPNDPEGDTIELKVVFLKSNSMPSYIPVTNAGASSDVAILKPMFSLPTPVSTDPSGSTPPGTEMTFKVLDGFDKVNFTEGKWWWDVYAWDATSGYSQPPRNPRSFILDFTKPVISNLVLNNPIFSPDSPNPSKQTTTLSYTLSETSYVTIEILNDSNVVIKSLTFDTLTNVPPQGQSITWDGKDTSGTNVPDGTYKFKVRARDLAGNEADEKTIDVIVSSTPPSISFGTPPLSNNPFSPIPASIGTKDTTTLSYVVSDTSNVSIVVYPSGSPGTIIKTLLSNQLRLPGNYTQTWDGTDDLTGNSVTDGTYVLEIKAVSNTGFETKLPISVNVDKTPADISPFTATPNPFSPNISPTNIQFSLNEDATVEIVIKDQAKVLTIRNLRPPTFMSQKLPPQFYQETWDGRDNAGNMVADGIYVFEITTEDMAGNKKTESGNIRVDKVGPIIGPYSVTPKAISPAVSPGITDSATISYTISKNGTVEIRIIQKGGPLVRKFGPYFKSIGNHSENWDGNDMTGNIVGEGEYNIEIYLIDEAGNIGNPNPATLTLYVDNTPPAITGVNVTPPFFSPKNTNPLYNTTSLRYNLSESSEVTIKVLDSLGGVVRTLINNVPQSAGIKNITWNGKDDSDNFVLDGTYTFEITATDLALNSTITTKTVEVDNTGPTVNIVSVNPTPFAPDSIDPSLKSTTIRYVLADARNFCTVEIKVKNKIGAIVKTLESNVQKPVGTLQTINWDGKNTIGQIVEDGTYGVYILAIDEAGNASLETSTEVTLLNKKPTIIKVRYIDNRDTIDTNDTIEVTFDMPIDDSAFTIGGVPVDVNSVFQIIGSGTFGTNARIETGTTPNDNIIEIRLGNGYTKIMENSDMLMIVPTSNHIRSYPVKVLTNDTIPHLILDGSPPYLISATYIDVGNDGINRGDQIILTFNENVSVANNSPSALQLLPIGRGYTIGGGASLSNGGTANQIVVTLGNVSTTSVVIRGKFDPYGINPIPTGINVVLGQTAIVDNAGNPATPNIPDLLGLTPPPPIIGVDIGSNETIGPKVVYAKYYDKNTAPGKGGLSDGDIIYVGFNKAIMVFPDPNPSPGTVFKLPVLNDAFGTGATFSYTGPKEVGITLGINPKITVKGTYALGNDLPNRPSGIDINIVDPNNPEISDLAGNPALPSIPVDIGTLDNEPPKILVGKIISQVGGDFVDNVINPTIGTFTIIAVVDDNTLKDGDVKVDIRSIFPDMTTEVDLIRDGTTTTFKKVINFPTNPYLTGSKTFTIKATDFSGNTSLPYTFTAYVVEPAAKVIAEINPSSIPKRIDLNAEPEEFIVTLKPTVMYYNLGIDKITIKHPGGGYSYTNDTIDVFIGDRKLIQNVNYTFNKNTVGTNLDITLLYDAKISEATSDQQINIKFKLNVPMTSNSPAGSTFEVYVNHSSLLPPYQQSVIGGDADGDPTNNNKLCVVVSDVSISDVQTKLEYSEFFWRINFIVKFNCELLTNKPPICSYKPENVQINEIPIQFIKFENKPDPTDNNKIKAYYTGYVRVPIDNIDYLSKFTLYARSFYDLDHVLIAKVYKKGIQMASGFIVTAFSNPIDVKDLIITILSTTPVTQPFKLGIRQPGKTPIYKSRTELISHRQNLYTYKYRIDENYSGQVDMAIFDPNESFPLSTNAFISYNTENYFNNINSNIYSFNVLSTDFKNDVNLQSYDKLCEVIIEKNLNNNVNNKTMFILSPQYILNDNLHNEELIKLSSAYQLVSSNNKINNIKIKFKTHPNFSEQKLLNNKNINDITSKLGIYMLDIKNNKWKFIAKPQFDGEYYLTNVNSFGIYALIADIKEPKVKNISYTNSYINFLLEDNGSSIDENNITLILSDGKTISLKPDYVQNINETETLISFSIPKLININNQSTNLSFEFYDKVKNSVKINNLNLQISNININNEPLQNIVAFPNPAKNYCKIRYNLNQNIKNLELKIYDSTLTLVYSNDSYPTFASNTPYEITWNLINNENKKVSNGIYYYKLKATLNNDEIIEKKGKIAVLK